jgi:hypothetical protein
MTTYKLNHHEYIKIIRSLAVITDDYGHESTINLLMDLLHVKFDPANLYFEVPTKLMQKIAIVNMCDFSLLQLRDSAGDIDYAGLGDNSKDVILSIIYHHI